MSGHLDTLKYDQEGTLIQAECRDDMIRIPCKHSSFTDGRGAKCGSLVCHHDMQRRKEPYAGEHSRSRILDVGVGV